MICMYLPGGVFVKIAHLLTLMLILTLTLTLPAIFTAERSQERSPPTSLLDVVIVAPGGTGCSTFISTLNKRFNVSTNNVKNFDNLKHSKPEEFSLWYTKTRPKIKAGIIYVMGDIISAMKSLTRRHWALIHAEKFAGDVQWLSELKYTLEYPNLIVKTDQTETHNNTHRFTYANLFTKKNERYRDIELVKNNPHVIDRTLLRMRELLSYAGRYGTDPIGMVNHFNQWHNFSSMKETRSNIDNIPILFLMFDDLISVNNEKRYAAETALKKFVNIKFKGYFVDAMPRENEDVLKILTPSDLEETYKCDIQEGIHNMNVMREKFEKTANKVFYIQV